jgi:hypothetical protein
MAKANTSFELACKAKAGVATIPYSEPVLKLIFHFYKLSAKKIRAPVILAAHLYPPPFKNFLKSYLRII